MSSEQQANVHDIEIYLKSWISRIQKQTVRPLTCILRILITGNALQPAIEKGKFTCMACDESSTFGRDDALVRHRKDQHKLDDTQLSKCPIDGCGESKEFSTVQKKKKHFEKSHSMTRSDSETFYGCLRHVQEVASHLIRSSISIEMLKFFFFSNFD